VTFHTAWALNVIHGAAKVWSLSDQQRTNCAVGLDWLRSVRAFCMDRPCVASRRCCFGEVGLALLYPLDAVA